MQNELPFDASVDVIVVGCGFAGANAAIAAHDAGASVLVLEKMSHLGGISICSAGGIRVATDADQAFAYLQRTNGNTAPDAVLRTLAEGMATIAHRVRALAAAANATVVYREGPGIYPFPGRECFGFVMVDEVEGFNPETEYRHAKSLGAGSRVFKVLHSNLKDRAIPIRMNSPVRRLLTTPEGRVNGGSGWPR